jgi:cysteine-rich repeat protein
MKETIRKLVRIAVSMAAGLVVLGNATNAGAAFHIMHIERIMTGLDGSTDFQFVQLRMYDNNQNVVSGAKLSVFNADGSFSHVALTLDKNVSNDDEGAAILMASTAFEAETGLTPDFVFSTDDGNALPAEDGMVCWGKPIDQTVPNHYVDCVSYGNYTGPDNQFTTAPSPVTPFGHGLVRIGDEGSSAEDFECEDPAVPTNNAPDKVGVPASTSCDGGPTCGDGAIDDPEECDDGDTSFTPGDFCSAECEAFSCGVPTSTTETTPRTSDALFVLKAGVGSESCDLEVCDINDNGAVNATDALQVLRAAVGQNVTLNCPT